MKLINKIKEIFWLCVKYAYDAKHGARKYR